MSAGNPMIGLRIDRASRLALQAICEIDQVNVSQFASEAVQIAVNRRLRELGKRISFGVHVPDEREPLHLVTRIPVDCSE
jgi:hypothetical protein